MEKERRMPAIKRKSSWIDDLNSRHFLRIPPPLHQRATPRTSRRPTPHVGQSRERNLATAKKKWNQGKRCARVCTCQTSQIGIPTRQLTRPHRIIEVVIKAKQVNIERSKNRKDGRGGDWDARRLGQPWRASWKRVPPSSSAVSSINRRHYRRKISKVVNVTFVDNQPVKVAPNSKMKFVKIFTQIQS